MNLTDALENSRSFSIWLDSHIGGKTLSGDLRSRVAAICFGVAQEHHAAITSLFASNPPLYSSAFALVRPLIEAYVRGMWLHACATDDEITKFLAGDVPSTRKLIAALEGPLDLDGPGNLMRVYARHWESLCGFTHTGAEHFERWSIGAVLEPNYDPIEIANIIDFSSRIALMSTAGLARMTDDPELCKYLLTEGKARQISIQARTMPPVF